MRRTVKIDPADVVPQADAVFASLAIPAPDAKTEALLQEALRLFRSLAQPAGLYAMIGVHQFGAIYEGQRRNEALTPLEEIFPKAEALALFAATVGREASARIRELFDARHFALASVLDAVASEATEVAADIVQRAFGKDLAEGNEVGSWIALLRYSPGYCGWHISGQRALFDALKPEEIGITLRESFLMEPLKSISGVIVAGPAGIHDFEDVYPFCADCRTRGCRERIRQIMKGRGDQPGRRE
jgi:hypothetical protein